MGRDVRSNLWTSSYALLITLIVLGCAQTATDLPPDYGSKDSNLTIDESKFSSHDLALTCPEIAIELAELRNQRAAIKSQIIASRDTDQTIGYFSSLLFPPLWLAVDNDDDYKAFLSRVQGRIDTLTNLNRFMSCKRTTAQTAKSVGEFEQEIQKLSELRESGVISSEEFLELRSRTFDKYYPKK